MRERRRYRDESYKVPRYRERLCRFSAVAVIKRMQTMMSTQCRLFVSEQSVGSHSEAELQTQKGPVQAWKASKR